MLCATLNIYCSFLLGFDRHLVQICDELLKDELLKGAFGLWERVHLSLTLNVEALK